MSRTSVKWEAYGGVDTDDPAQMEEWARLCRALQATVQRFANPLWTEHGTGTLWIMCDGEIRP